MDSTGVVGCELGRRSGRHPQGYPGTDAMSMTAIVPTERWLLDGADGLPLVVLEGTRLANKRFVEAAQNGHHRLQVYYLYDPATAVVRRAARGSNQDPQWLKGRQTAARNFYDLCDRLSYRDDRDIQTFVITAKRPLEDTARYLRTMAGIALPVS
jgi:hypothetical protein